MKNEITFQKMIYCLFRITNELNNCYEDVYFKYETKLELELDEANQFDCAYNLLPERKNVQYSTNGEDLDLIAIMDWVENPNDFIYVKVF